MRPVTKIRADHRVGQYRAQLFDELVGVVLPHSFPAAKIERNYLLRSEDSTSSLAVSFDYAIHKLDGHILLVEAKAPYTISGALAVKRTLRTLLKRLRLISKAQHVEGVLLALAMDFPSAARDELETLTRAFQAHDLSLTVWDSRVIGKKLAKALKLKVNELSIPALERALGKQPVPSAELTATESATERAPVHLEQSLKALAGQIMEVVVLCADFCSYSRFVHASGGDIDLITSVMGRFYRSARGIISSNGGLLDKFMGDGIIAYWVPNQGTRQQVLTASQELVGLSVKLAEEWQDQVDLSVSPQGMRVGAALGGVLFIPEGPATSGAIHAIGEAINIAARLQTVADPNAIVISNRLKTRCFPQEDGFTELPPTALKNIGEVIAWTKAF